LRRDDQLSQAVARGLTRLPADLRRPSRVIADLYGQDIVFFHPRRDRRGMVVSPGHLRRRPRRILERADIGKHRRYVKAVDRLPRRQVGPAYHMGQRPGAARH